MPEPERRALTPFLGRRPDALIRRHRGLLLPELVATAFGTEPSAEVVTEVPAPSSAEAPPPEQAPAKKRGRRRTGTALTGAERARRWRQAHAVADVQMPRPLADRIKEMAAAKCMRPADLVEAALDGMDLRAQAREPARRAEINGRPVFYGAEEVTAFSGHTASQVAGRVLCMKRPYYAGRLPPAKAAALARGELVFADSNTALDPTHLYKRFDGCFLAVPG